MFIDMSLEMLVNFHIYFFDQNIRLALGLGSYTKVMNDH